MIKVNLNESVFERRHAAIEAVERRVLDPRTQTWIILGVVITLLIGAMVLDYMLANNNLATVNEKLRLQQQIAGQMAEVNKEQAGLEKRAKDIESRIAAIRKLRVSQRGPVEILSAINSRLPAGEFRLDSVELKGNDLSIRGDSPNEALVTQFARSLEFSNGMFANFSIETEKKDLPVEGDVESLPRRPQTVFFIIKCKYNPEAAIGHSQPATGTQQTDQLPQPVK